MDDLQTWKERNGVSDSAIAASVGVSRVQIVRIRNGKSGTRPTVAQKLESLTGIPAMTFLVSSPSETAA